MTQIASIQTLAPNFNRKPRTYEVIWRQLRYSPTHVCVLRLADAAFLPRVKRMISKEKDRDIGFKLINEVERQHLKFTWNQEKKELKVELTNRFGIVEIVS